MPKQRKKSNETKNKKIKQNKKKNSKLTKNETIFFICDSREVGKS